MTAVLCKIGESNNVSRLFVTARLVCDPYFNTGDIQTGTNGRQTSESLIVCIPEMLCKKEVPVGFIVVGINFKLAQLGPALY